MKFALLLAAALLGACGSTAPSTTTAAVTAPATSNEFGVLVMAHGGSPEWNDHVLAAVAPLRDKYKIEVAFGMADAKSLQEAVSKLEGQNIRQIAVVRVFISGESWFDRTEQILGLEAGAPAKAGSGDHDAHAGHDGTTAADPHAGHHGTATPDPHAGHHGAAADPHAGHAAGGHGGHSMEFYRIDTQSTFELSKDGLADAGSMGQVLADRANALSTSPATEDILILAHGPGDDAENERWLQKIDALAAGIRATPFRRVQVETLREDWPEKRVAAEERIKAFVTRAKSEGGTAIVIPFRVQGFGPYKDVLTGLEYRSDGVGLMPHPAVGQWIEAQIHALENGQFRAPIAK